MHWSPCRLPALLLLSTAACLAAASPAAAQMDVVEPRLLNRTEIVRQIGASYPAAQRDSAVRGHVTLYFKVREDSTIDPASVSVREASNPAFVTPATALVPAMRYAPARVSGRTMATWITHTVAFEIPPPAGTVPPGEGMYELAVVEEQPVLRDRGRVARRIAARFPAALRDRGVTAGAVVVRFRIMENGTVEPASPRVEMTTEPGFDEAAISVIREMRFQPAKVNGRAVRVWVAIPVQFELPEAESAQAAGTAPPGG